MDAKKDKAGRQRRTMYLSISREVQVAARTRALTATKTLSEIVEEALRLYLSTTPPTTEDQS